jgi:hypothetical protein
MPNLRIVNTNLADSGTTTASSQASASLSVANLRTKAKGAPWRSAAGTTQRLSHVLAAPAPVGLVALTQSNLSASAQGRLRQTTETAATNLFLQSQVLSNAVYTKTATTAGTAAAALDGTTSAIPILETAVTAGHTVHQSANLTSGTTYTFSQFVKANGRTRVALQNGTLGTFANFNLITGTMLTTGGTGYVGGGITNMGGGWYRLRLTFTANATSAQNLVLVLQDAAGTASYLGVVSNGVYSWGWQLEVGAISSYYPTTTTTATRPQGYIDSWQTYASDTGFVNICPGEALVPDGWSAAQAASAYAYGGGMCARLWTDQSQPLATGLAFDIVDSGNLQGYIEAVRLVVGTYYETAINPDYGSGAEAVDRSKSEYSEAGDLITEPGTRSTKLTLDMSQLGAADRAYLWKVLRTSGTSRPVFVSVFPDAVDGQLEQMHQIYGQLVTTPSMKTPFFNLATATLDIQGA